MSYNCTFCEYITIRKDNFEKHLKTPKHLKKVTSLNINRFKDHSDSTNPHNKFTTNLLL